MDGVNNLVKKWVSCRDNSLFNGLWPENIIDFENIGNTIHDLCNEELHGERCYTSKDGVQAFLCDSSFNSRSKDWNEDDIGEGGEEARA